MRCLDDLLSRLVAEKILELQSQVTWMLKIWGGSVMKATVAARAAQIGASKGAMMSLHQHYQQELVNKGIKKYSQVLLK